MKPLNITQRHMSKERETIIKKKRGRRLVAVAFLCLLIQPSNDYVLLSLKNHKTSQPVTIMNPSLQPTALAVFIVAYCIFFTELAVSNSDDGDDAIPVVTSACRSYCGNISVGYPFGLHSGCGHPGFRNLLYCMNSMLMLHIPSGTYRVLSIDYAYNSLTLHDSSMSDCYSLTLSSTATSTSNGFVIELWRAPYLSPAQDNVFMLLGCRADSPLFQGFPGKHLPCRNVSGMGCDEYYQCPAWGFSKFSARNAADLAYGSVSPPECCSLEFGAIRSINLTHLRCEGYSSAYSLAPLRARGPGGWSYGIRVSYSLPADHDGECHACEATGGMCGYDPQTNSNLCICPGGLNMTSTCDSVGSLGSTMKGNSSIMSLICGLSICLVAWIYSL